MEAEAVPIYRFQLPLPLPQKFTASTASASSFRFRFHIPGFNATSKRVFNHQEVKIDQKMLFLYFLQNYYLKEIMRGNYNFGEWNLKLFHLRKLIIGNVHFPKDAISPDEAARVVRNDRWLIKKTLLEAGLRE